MQAYLTQMTPHNLYVTSYVVDLVVTGLRQGGGVFIPPFWREIAYGILNKNNGDWRSFEVKKAV